MILYMIGDPFIGLYQNGIRYRFNGKYGQYIDFFPKKGACQKF